jgi:hypothetical protein
MSSVYTEIRAALENHLADASGLPTIAWQNVDYRPTTGTPFIKFQFQPNFRESAVMGTSPPQYYRGLCTFLLHYPENSGPGTSQSVVDTLVDRFEATTDITFSTTTLTIESVRQGVPYDDPPWFVTPVVATWYIYS